MMSVTAIPQTDESIDSSSNDFELPVREFHDLLSAPPIARDQLLEQCLSNMAFARMLLNEFEKTSYSRLETIEAALADRDYAAIATKAHAFKGVAGILAAGDLMQTCSDLEAAAVDADLNLTHALIHQLQYETQRILDFIPSLCSLT